MKVKKYIGASLEKIREVIVRELGESAVIINIREQAQSSKPGFFSSGKKSGFEVIAAVEEATDVDQIALEKNGGAAKMIDDILTLQKEQYRGIRNSIRMIDEKIAEVDDKMENFSFKTGPEVSPMKELANIHDEWKPLIIQALKKIVRDSENPTGEDWHEALASLLPTAGGIMFRRTPSSAPDVYVFIGPTGVGKTTTLAKLAAKCILAEKLNTGLITLDTFRVAAVEQLREYSTLLGAEIGVAFSADELRQQLKQFYEKDLVFIDTPGRSQFDKSGIKNIKDCLGTIGGLCVLLVVPANIRKEDAVQLYESYRELKPSALVISKTDEAGCCDGITTLLAVSKLPVVYLTDGQRVPEDIHVASPGIIASMVMPFVKCGEPVKIGENING